MMTGFQRMLRLFIPTGLLLTALASCHESKYLTENQTLYTANKTQVQSSVPMTKKEQKKWSEEMQRYLRPKLNSKILGIRVKLWIYNIAGTTNKKKGFQALAEIQGRRASRPGDPRDPSQQRRSAAKPSREQGIFSRYRYRHDGRQGQTSHRNAIPGRSARAIPSGRSTIRMTPM